MKEKIIFILIILLATFLRFYNLDKVPAGFYSDEASISYNAYSILKTGKDEYGNFLPITFKAFGEGKLPGLIYLLVPFEAVFGLTVWGARACSALLGVGSVILTFFLVKKLFKDNKIALVSSFLLAISPWALQFNRMVSENNLAVFLIILGTLMFLKGLEKGYWLVFSLAVFVLSTYSYLGARAFSPIFLLFLFIIYFKEIMKQKKWIFLAIIFALVISLPLLRSLTSGSGWSRVTGTNIFQDRGYVMKIDEERGEDQLMIGGPNKIIHNKLVDLTYSFLKNYTDHFSPAFLFVSGDPIEIYNTPYNGVLYWWELPFLIAGIVFLLSHFKKEGFLIFGWLLLAFVPAGLTRFTPSALRSLIALPTFEIVIAVGFICLYNYWKLLRKFKLPIATAVIFLAAFNFYYYSHEYYVHLPIHYERQWQTGFSEVVNDVKLVQDNYDQVFISTKSGDYIHFLFFLKYPPQKYQPQAHLSPLDQYGFGHIDSFDKYRFSDFPTFFELDKNILYVGMPGEFPSGVQPLKTIYYPDKTIAFYLVGSDAIRKLKK